MSKDKHSSIINFPDCVVDPQLQLASALARNDVEGFQIAIANGAQPERLDDKHMSVYEQALKTHGCGEFVKLCLNNGCDPSYMNDHIKKAAINFAADSRDPKIIQALLSYKGVQIDHQYVELTPLNSLAKSLTPENADDVSRCIRLLLDYGASANIPDQRSMTPVLYVLKNRKIDGGKKLELIKMFLEHGNLDLDTYRDGEARQLLEKDYPALELPAPVTDITFDALLSLARNGEESRFLELYPRYKLNLSQRDNVKNVAHEQSVELLIEFIKRGKQRAVESLLQDGDVNATHDGNTPIQIAAIWGNWQALQALLSRDDLVVRKRDNLLSTVIKKMDQKPLFGFEDFNKCFDTLLDSNKIDVNAMDTSRTTPLHYAVKYRNHKAIEKLLRRGAYIGTKSLFGDLPIDGIHPEMLEEHFNYCISTNRLKPGDEDFEIHMNYMNLMPPPPTPTNLANGKSQLHEPQNLRQEMAPIAFIADSKEHRHLLQHPLVTSFLFLKWHRLSVTFYINFLFYAFFAISIITHTVLKFRESDHSALIALFGWFTWIGIIYLLLREIVQFIMSPRSYLRSATNYVELLLIVLSAMTCLEPGYDDDTERVIAVFTILLVALELCLLVGSLPVLSISTHMLMLRAVATSFLKSFTLYSIFVITFSLCFYMLFGKPPVRGQGDASSPGSEEGEEGDFNKFTSPFTAVIKTIVMLTGEFDAGDLGMKSFSAYFLFLLFVVFMSIVLFNLLNGLAVSDTQAIKAQAELNGSIVRANLLTRYEEVLTGHTGHFSALVNYEPLKTICRRLMNLYPNYIGGRRVIILPNDNNKIMIPIVGGSDAMEDDAKEKPNGKQESKKLLDGPVDFLPCCCSCITGKCSVMDKRTVKLAMAVIEQKANAANEKARLQSTETRLQNIEKKLEAMLFVLNRLQAK